MKVLVSVFNNLSTDQRVEKVCKTLMDHGYQVELVGNNWNGLPFLKRDYPTKRLSLKSTSLKTAYLEFNVKLYKYLLKSADKKTILLANDLDILVPNFLVSKKLNIPLVFDSHEIFTEMPAIQGRFTQKIWRLLERKYLPKIKYMMTESESYSEWFQEKYQIKPIVVRNIPKRIIDDIVFPENRPKVILYQGVINQSRGLPQAIEAMKYLENVVFKIIGDGPKRKEFEGLVLSKNLEKKVQFLGQMLPEDMRKVTKTADVGLSLEENGGVSYLYSLPNKVSDYIQAKVPLVMINFPEMMRIKNEFNVGEIVENHEPKNIAEKIETVLKNGRKYYKLDLENAGKKLCWEEEELKIKELFEKVVKENS
ncbi:glycosyltransferase [Frigoriflavimonas asaccharolytica]|uniref:Glycosyltransferase involved in cell wall biosynthesis n=1 Tax=Frigoriflavimonas asaccharolytica TaxID=2735899 RepID=A0A8J8G8U0_9FLAO|nr:glycosyltransferase [Frigoriflavimonas asaccharolytica]NRS91087.1 glycosyltransferase involved in cell wall biosynthesis [Frigoriflavimonas asaccharolytica]